MVICIASTLFYRRFAYRQLWTLLLVLALLVPAQAAHATEPDPLAQAQAALDRIKSRLASPVVATETELKAHEEEFAKIRFGALDCVEQAEQKIAKLDSELAVLRDVDRRFRVISDINFAIDVAFREQGIEIPFPQRDLNLRTPLKLERDPAAPRGAPNGDNSPQL